MVGMRTPWVERRRTLGLWLIDHVEMSHMRNSSCFREISSTLLQMPVLSPAVRGCFDET